MELGLLGFLWQGLTIQNAPPQFEVVVFVKELSEFRRFGQFKLTLAQSSVLQSHNHKTREWICPLGLVPVTYGHANDPWTIPYWVQDAQIAAICFNGACEALTGGLLHGSYSCCTDLEVGVWDIGDAPWPGHPLQGICINISLPCPIIQLKVVTGQAGHPSVTHSIQLECH